MSIATLRRKRRTIATASVVAVLVLAAAAGSLTRMQGHASTNSDVLAGTSAPTLSSEVTRRPHVVTVEDEAEDSIAWNEYEAAVFATVACMEDVGLVMRTQPHLDASGKVLRFTVRLTGDDSEDDRIRQTARACHAEHLDEVNRVRAQQLRPSEEQLRDAREAMATCLIVGGVDPAHVATERLQEAVTFAQGTIFPDCANQIAAEFGIPSFGG